MIVVSAVVCSVIPCGNVIPNCPNASASEYSGIKLVSNPSHSERKSDNDCKLASPKLLKTPSPENIVSV